MIKKLVVALSFSACFALPALACEAPANKPEIPDPLTAVTAQMVKSNNEVKAYVSSYTAYLNCAGLGSAELRKEERALKEYAEQFNQAIREFKLASK